MQEPMTYRDRLRVDVLALARRLLEAEGLDALQARRIASEAGCSVGSLYNVFGDIDGLVVELNAATLDRLGRSLSDAFQAEVAAGLHDQLLALALGYMRFAAENRHAWEAVFKYQRTSVVPEPESYLEAQEQLLALIAHSTAEFITAAPERELAARALFAAVHGVVALAMDNRIGGKLRADLERHVRFLVGVLARGIEASGGR